MVGAVKAITGTTKVISRLRNNRGLLHRLGLDDNETSRLLTAAPGGGKSFARLRRR